MSELVFTRTPEGIVTRLRYTRDEIRASWRDGQRNECRKAFFQFRQGGRPTEALTMFAVSEEEAAFQFEAVLLRRLHADLYKYCYESSYLWVLMDWDRRDLIEANLARIYRAWDIAGVDEGGRLFAEEGHFDVEVPELVRCLRDVAIECPQVRERVDRVLRAHYFGDPRARQELVGTDVSQS